MKPSPVELSQGINPETSPKRLGVEHHRHLDCSHYDNCLNEAVRRGWQSFTCMKCALFVVPAVPEKNIEAFATQRRAV